MHKTLATFALLSLLILISCQQAAPEVAITSTPVSAAATNAPATAAALPTAAPTHMSAPTATPIVAATNPRAFGDTWSSIDCASLGVAAQLVPQSDCGYVTVPENRAAGSKKMIELAVVRLRTDAASPGTPVVLATGGPGSNGLARTTNVQLIAPFGPIIGNRDWVFFSQRGTEHAKPQLVCPAYMRISADAVLNGSSDAERRAKRAPAIKACVDRYTADGVDLSAYNSNENAADVASITQALGYSKISLYGQSYGTQLAQFVMRNHPEILQSVIIDGVVPVSAATESAMHPANAGFGPIFAACAADATCDAAYPNAEAALREAYAALEAKPQPMELLVEGKPMTATVDGTLALSALFSDLYGSGEYALLPYIATQMRAQNYAPLIPLINSSLEPASISIMMHFTITCTDDPNSEQPAPDSSDMYRDITDDDDSQYSAVCPVMAVKQLPESSDAPVRSDIPTLVLQGAFDPVTPVANGNNVAASLPNSYNIVFSTGTHINGTHECGVAIMNAFISDPSKAPDASCAQQPVAFAVPQTVTTSSADGNAKLTVTLPPGFRAGPSGSYVSPSNNLILFAVLPPQAPEDALKASTAAFPGVTITDGDPVAGLPTKRAQVNDFAVGQAKANLDFIAFSDAAGTYIISVQNQDPSALKAWRTGDLPAILSSAKVSSQ